MAGSLQGNIIFGSLYHQIASSWGKSLQKEPDRTTKTLAFLAVLPFVSSSTGAAVASLRVGAFSSILARIPQALIDIWTTQTYSFALVIKSLRNPSPKNMRTHFANYIPLLVIRTPRKSRIWHHLGQWAFVDKQTKQYEKQTKPTKQTKKYEKQTGRRPQCTRVHPDWSQTLIHSNGLWSTWYTFHESRW